MLKGSYGGPKGLQSTKETGCDIDICFYYRKNLFAIRKAGWRLVFSFDIETIHIL